MCIDYVIVCVRINMFTHTIKQDDLANKFPALDLFFFLTFDALCTVNHYIEGSFSNKGQLLRHNLSDERIDRKAKYRQNESGPIAKDVVSKACARRESKGCKGPAKSAFTTMGDVQEYVAGHKRNLDSGYRNADFKHPDCPTNRSHRDSVKGQITANDR